MGVERIIKGGIRIKSKDLIHCLTVREKESQDRGHLALTKSTFIWELTAI